VNVFSTGLQPVGERDVVVVGTDSPLPQEYFSTYYPAYSPAKNWVYSMVYGPTGTPSNKTAIVLAQLNCQLVYGGLLAELSKGFNWQIDADWGPDPSTTLKKNKKKTPRPSGPVELVVPLTGKGVKVTLQADVCLAHSGDPIALNDSVAWLTPLTTPGMDHHYQSVCDVPLIQLGKNELSVKTQAGDVSEVSSIALLDSTLTIGFEEALPLPEGWHDQVGEHHLYRPNDLVYFGFIIIPSVLIEQRRDFSQLSRASEGLVESLSWEPSEVCVS
jgi:hypothetical protein